MNTVLQMKNCIRMVAECIDIQFHRYGGFFVCLAFVIANTSLVQGVTSTCGNLTATVGSPLILTCIFGDDLNNIQATVYVDHLQINHSRHALLASCRWTPNGHECKTMSGYRLVGKVTKTLSMEIANISKIHAGKYWCEIFGSNYSDRTTCEISVIEASVLNTVNTSPQTISSTGERNGIESTGVMDGNFRAQAIAMGSLVALTCIAITALVFTILYLKTKCCFKGSHPNSVTSHNDVNNACEKHYFLQKIPSISVNN